MTKKFILIGVVLFALLLVPACRAAQTDPVAATQPAATAVSPEPISTPTAVIPTDEPETDTLAAFIAQLETAVSTQDYAAMQTLMSDPLAVGAWRSEWRSLTPAQALEQFQNASLPSPSAVQFTGLDEEEMTALIGQPPAGMFAPDMNVAAALHSTGWGQSASDDAILFVVDEDGRFTWSAFLYTNGRFADANIGAVAAPVGLIYRVANDGTYQIQANGERQLLLDEATAGLPNLHVSPDGRHAAFFTENNELGLINTSAGDQQLLAVEFTLSGFLMWADKDTLFIGVWLDPNEADGPNNGHIATLDIDTGVVQIFDEERLSGGRPALLSANKVAAFDVFAEGLNGRLHFPEGGVQVFDPSTFSSSDAMLNGGLTNPAWLPDGRKIAWIATTGDRFAVQVFDLVAETAVQLHDWDPARFGGLIPSPVWNADGTLLALHILANGPEGSGIWVMDADGSSVLLVDAQGQSPQWANSAQLVFNINNSTRLYDVASGESYLLDLPENSTIIAMTDPVDLLAGDSQTAVVDTPVGYVMALQDVTMYSGPGADYEEIGGIFDGQTALVTGQSQDGGWWRMICPDDSIGDCWVSADPGQTLPVDGAEAQLERPDPATLTAVSDVTVNSPDGVWQAAALQTEPAMITDISQQIYVSLSVSNGTTTWQPVDEWRGYGLGYTWPAVYQWSADSRFLYFTNQTSVDGCGLFVNGTDLYRLDVTDGSVATLLQPNETWSFALTPNEDTIAFIGFEGYDRLSVVMRENDIGYDENGNLINEPNPDASEWRIPLDSRNGNIQAGNLVWSPDGGLLLVTVAHAPCGIDWTHSTFLIDDQQTITVLIDQDEHRMTTVAWDTPEVVHLVDKDGQSWLLDIISGELSQ